MQDEIKGAPAFAYLDVTLDPGESIIAESDAMATMGAKLELNTKLNGGLFGALGRKLFGGESLFINEFKNNSSKPQNITLTQPTPGDVRKLELKGKSMYLQPGAFICCTPGVELSLSYAGFKSLIAREGLFRLKVSGHGCVWYGAYGALVEKEIKGEYIVDTSHLVAYEPQITLNLQLAGGIFSSFFSGEGLVSRMEGKGKIIIQTRSIDGLANWTNRLL
jgi:uncharacterized protein (TIGR00266 family)